MSRTSAALRPLRESEPEELDRILSREAEGRLARMGADFTPLGSWIRNAALRGELPGLVVGPRGRAVGYGFLAGRAGRAAVGGLWVVDGHPAAARELALGLMAMAGGGRVEAQDLGFGEVDFSQAFEEAGLRPFPRLYMECSLSAAASSAAPRLPRGLRLEPWTPGCLLPAADVSFRAFAETVDREIDASYRSVLGCLDLLGSARDGFGYGPLVESASRLAVDAAGRLQGFILVTRLAPTTAHVVQVAVRPEASGRGLGRALIENACREAARGGTGAMTLAVTEANERAVGLYRSLGFRERRRFAAWVGDHREFQGESPEPMDFVGVHKVTLVS